MEVSKIVKRISILIIGFLLSICIFSNNNIFAANTLEPQKIEDEQLFTLIYETEEYKSGNYYLLIGRNDLGYYKILFLKKTDTLKVYINNFNGNDYRIYYSEPVSQVWYNADKNPTSLNLRNKNFTENDNKFYKSNSREFYSDFNIYTDNTYTSFFYEGNNSFVFSFPSITLTTSSYPSRVQIIETQPLTGMDLDLYEICYSFNDGNWKSMFHSSDDSWFTSATRNGVYKFRYCYKGTTNQVEGTTTSSLTITNIITSGSEFSDDVVSPILTIEYNGLKDGSTKSVSIRTQYMTYDEISHLDFYWSDGTNLHPEDITLWYTNNFYSTEINGITYYYFQQSIYENVTFSCSFYDGLKGQFSQISVAEIDINKYYEEYKESKEDPPTLFEHILKALNSLNPFSSEFLGYKLVGLFGDLLKSLFVPSDNFFTSNIDNLKSQISNKMPYSDFLKIFGSIENVSAEDNSISINMPEYKISDNLTIKQDKFIDFSFVTKYREVWYSWVRGFVLIFLVIYNLNQISKLLRGINISDAATSIGMQQPSNGQISGQISLFGGKKR